jgi:hypothetical protein
VEQRIVQGKGNSFCSAQDFDQHHGQYLPKFVDVPTTIWKKAVIGIVSTLKARIGKWQDAGYRSPSSAQNPANHQMREYLCTRSRENWKKLLSYICPSRNNCMHIDLLVLIVYSIKTSAGRYVFVYKPLKSVA